MKNYNLRILFISLFCLVGFVHAEGYVRFSTTYLYCVVDASANTLATITPGQARINRSISETLAELKKAVSQLNKKIPQLKRQLGNTQNSRKKAQIQKQLKAGTLLLQTAKSTIIFINQCSSRALDSQAVATPSGGSAGNGGLKR